MNDVTSDVPDLRIRAESSHPLRHQGDFVLYWMTAFRRCRWNFALQRAADWAEHLRKPLLILEALRCDYPWASPRFHRFIIDGMRDNENRLRDSGVKYYPYMEDSPGAGSGLIKALSKQACLIVTDDFPCFIHPRLVATATRQTNVYLETVDSNGLLPLRAADKVYPTAYSLRRFLQKSLPDHLRQFPLCDPLAPIKLPQMQIPDEILGRWPIADLSAAAWQDDVLQRLPLDHSVGRVSQQGGASAAAKRLDDFFEHQLVDYAELRNHPDDDATSGFSPYLHFGHLSVYEIFHRLIENQGWHLGSLSSRADGRRSGWWGMRAAAESFIDELITWRELGFNMCWQRDDFDRFESLPDWAKETLRHHKSDPRPHLYSLAELENATTHDALWNSAQRQLVREGRIHNYLRMVWGKKILQWSPTPEQALEAMIQLNNKYALDGRDPNSYSGIFWVLGRYDRAWGPERPIFGKIRFMSSRNTARKVRVRRYLERYG